MKVEINYNKKTGKYMWMPVGGGRAQVKGETSIEIKKVENMKMEIQHTKLMG